MAATLRHRFSQFNNYFLEKNIEIEIQSLLSNEYLKKNLIVIDFLFTDFKTVF